MKVIGLLIVLSLGAVPARAVESIWPIEGQFGLDQGNDPKKSAAENLRSLGGDLSLSVAPVFYTRGSAWRFTPSYETNYSGVNNVLKVDENLYLFAQQWDQQLDFGGTYRPNADTRYTTKAFYGGFNGKLAADEPWFRGLYDYQDGGLYFDWTQKWATQLPMKTTLGVRGTDRRYPNYVTLAVPQVHEKDAGIAKLYGTWELIWPGDKVRSTLDFSTEAVTYKEAIVVDPDGTTGSATKRKDQVTRVTLSVPIKSNANEWLFGYGIEARQSNHAYFDTSNFVYTGDYDDYAEHSFNFSYAYSFEKAWWFLQAPQLSLDAKAVARLYAGRLAKDSNGKVKTAKQVDYNTNVAIGLNSPVSEHWSAYVRVSTANYQSNNEDQSSSLNNYQFNTFSLGTQFAY